MRSFGGRDETLRRIFSLLTLVAVLLSTFPLMASAARIDASAFAADCNDDGTVNVTGTLTVVGGSGTIADNCFIFIDDHGKLEFRGVNLDSVGCVLPSLCGLIVGGSGANSTVNVSRSTIDVNGPIQLSAGCCGGDIPETKGSTRVVDSVLKGSSVEVSASVADDGGRVVVRRSTLEATGPFGVSVRTSLNGTTRFNDNVVISFADTAVTSGPLGTTTVRRNDFAAVSGLVTITANGGRCVSAGNIPSVPCT